MTKIYFVSLLLLSVAAKAQFTTNNLAVLKITSPTAIGNTGISYPVSIVEYSTAGVATATNINLTGGTPDFVLEERSIAHEGQLNLSTNGLYLTAVGYNSTVGATAATIRTTEKRVARIDAAGTVNLTTNVTPANAFNGVGVRSAVSNDGSSYWITSSVSNASHGTRTIAHNSTAQALFNANSYRSIGLFGGVIYGSVATSPVINSHDAAGVATPLPFATPTVTSPEYTQFVFFDIDATVSYNSTGFDLLYVADRQSGIRKFYFDAATSLWTPVSTTSGLYNTGLGGVNGFHALTGRLEAGKPTLYGIKIQGGYTASHLIKVVDNVARTIDWNTTGNFATATLLASTGNTEQFKGVAFTPGSAILLPVALTSFTGSLISNHAVLVWKSATEAGAREYEIERSSNDKDYMAIGTIAARNGAGANSYSFADAGVLKGINYYRLKLVDKNGKFTYSSVVVLKTDGKNGGLSIFPNPVVSNLVISHTKAAKADVIRIVGTDGKIIAQYKVAENAIQTSVDAANLKSGRYIINYIGNTKKISTSFIKL